MEFYNSDGGKFQNSGVFVNGNNNNVNITNSSSKIADYDIKQGLTPEEWQLLEWYFIECQAMFTEQTKYYKACVEILDTIHNRDAHGFRKNVKDMAKAVFDGIIAAGSELAISQTAMAILNKMGLG